MAGQAEDTPGRSRSFVEMALPAGSCCSVPIFVHILLPLYAGVETGAALLRKAPEDPAGNVAGFALLTSGVLLFATVLVHELGHCMAARCVGARVDRILLWPLGGLAYIGAPETACQDSWVAFAGPLTHLPQSLLLLATLALASGCASPSSCDGFTAWEWYAAPGEGFYEGASFWRNALTWALRMQVYMAAFNLLVPAFPLDGGRLLANSLTQLLAPERAARATCVVCFLCVAGLAVWGITTSAWTLLAVAVWTGMQGWELWRAVGRGEVHRHPLFCRGGGAAVAGGAPCPAAAGGGSGGGGGWTAFQGDGRVLGRDDSVESMRI